MSELHLITINETAEQELHACGAKLLFCISGKAFFTGNEAFKKAEEVNQCIQALEGCGIEADQIVIENVSATIETGVLTKSSSASYYISCHCKSLDQLGSTLAAMMSQKNNRLSKLEWEYDEREATQTDLLKTAVGKTKAQAELVASTLGTRVIAVHSLKYEFQGLSGHGYAGEPSQFDGLRRQKRSASTLRQLSLNHKATLRVQVSAEFALAEL